MPGFIHTHFAKGATGAALTFVEAANSEIQPFNESQYGDILTVQGNVSALTLAVFGELTCLQEPGYANAYFPIKNQNDGVVATGEPNEQAHTPIGKRIPRDGDLTSTPAGPGSDTTGIAVHVAYGVQPPKWPAGKMIVKKVVGTGDDSTAWTAFASGTISNLDPTKSYALVGLCPVIEDQAGVGIRVSAPSLGGLRPGMLYAGGGVPSFWKNQAGEYVVAGVINGAETITLESLSHVAQTPDCLVYLIEIGVVGISPGVGVGATVGGSSNVRTPTAFSGVGSKLVGGIFGRR